MDDFTPFLQKIKPIDFVYCGLAKPDYFRYWYKLAGKPVSITYETYLESIIRMIAELKPKECHLEISKGISDLFFGLADTLDYASIMTLPILYSAPTDHYSNRYAKKRNQDIMAVMSNSTLELPKTFTYSHEYLDQVLSIRRKIRCFDPCIGKGLLTKFALKHGHSCFGIDMNYDRLAVAIKMVK